MKKENSTSLLFFTVGKKKYQIKVFPRDTISSFNINDLYLHCIKKTLYDIRRVHNVCNEDCPENCLLVDKRFWFETDLLTVKYKYSDNIYKENSDEGSIVVSCTESLRSLVESIEHKVIDIFENDYTNQIIGSTILTFESIQKMFKSGINYENSNACNMRFNIHKKHCCVFLNNQEQEVVDFDFNLITSKYNVSMIIEPQFVWVMNNNIGLRWNVKQIHLLDIPQEPQFELLESINSSDVDNSWSLNADNSTDNTSINDNSNENSETHVTHEIYTTWSLECDSDSSIVEKSKAWSLECDSDSSHSNHSHISTKAWSLECDSD